MGSCVLDGVILVVIVVMNGYLVDLIIVAVVMKRELVELLILLISVVYSSDSYIGTCDVD